MEKKIYDDQLGEILLRSNPRAVKYSLRVRKNRVIAIMPEGGDEKTILRFIKKNKDKLLYELQKSAVRCIVLNEETKLQTNTFQVHIFRTDRSNIYMSLKDGTLHIACPQRTDFESEEVQDMLKELLERALRHEAKRVLPGRLDALAQQHGFTYARMRISNAKSKWGCCTSKGNIILSLSVMLLPDHLVDYILLHELCHTVEMNHGKAFWARMNEVTDGQALALRKEMRNYEPL
jgi:predicted metal-dependent hydrolase